MADEKSKKLTGANGPGKDPAQPEAGGSPAPGKEQKAPVHWSTKIGHLNCIF